MEVLLSTLALPLRLIGMLFRAMVLIKLVVLVGIIYLLWNYVGPMVSDYVSINDIKNFFRGA